MKLTVEIPDKAKCDECLFLDKSKKYNYCWIFSNIIKLSSDGRYRNTYYRPCKPCMEHRREVKGK